ncbi:MAG: Cof-type HAD-IIB family hydrolase [Ignavibacteriaceae bacterium]|nr:Cof-type HAD-IIB family hydrolase [Ignavibacteriaceae bacterium]
MCLISAENDGDYFYMMDANFLRNIQLVVLDLDGTLLDSRGEIGKETKALVPRLQQLGVRFTFASGRVYSALTDYAAELGIKTPLIALDGILIKDYPNGNTLSTSRIPEDKVRKAIEYSDKYLIKIGLCHENQIYVTEYNASIAHTVDKFGSKFIEVDSYKNYTGETLEIIFVSDRKDNLTFLRDKFAFPFTFGLRSSFTKSYSNENIYILEVRRSGINKSTGLKTLLKKLGLKITNTAVVGDWYNDVDLFKTKALKIALSNAVPEIKYLSDHVTTRTNNEDGVAEFLEELYKAKTS